MIVIPPELFDETERLASAWESEDKILRLWSGDASIWSGAAEGQQLGWLRIIEKQRQYLDPRIGATGQGDFDDIEARRRCHFRRLRVPAFLDQRLKFGIADEGGQLGEV